MAMITWAFKRQIFYILILILFFSVCGFLILYPRLNKAPICTDGIQNGTETGIDCGGSCANACLAEVTHRLYLIKYFVLAPIYFCPEDYHRH